MKKSKRTISLDMFLVQCFVCSEYYLLQSNSRDKFCPGCGGCNQSFCKSNVRKFEVTLDNDD